MIILILLNSNVLLTYLQPSIEIGNLRIDEPITLATDMLMAGVCFYAYFRIKKRESARKIKWYFKYYFLTLGLGAFFGGLLGHAFLYRIAPPWKLVSWIFTLIAVAMMAQAILELSRPLVKIGFVKFIGRLNLLILAFAIFYTIWTLTFSAVQYYTIFGMIAIVGTFSFFIFHNTGSKGAARFLVAVGVGVISAFVFNFKWGISPWFNHNDICHVLITCSVFVFYKGAALILDSNGAIT